MTALEQIAQQTAWDLYSDFLQPPAIKSLVEERYSRQALSRRMLAGTVLVATDEGEIVGFADISPASDHVAVKGLWAVDPAAVVSLLDAVTARGGSLPISFDVLLGDPRWEATLERRGFVPGETFDTTAGVEPVLMRRWWLTPATAPTE